MESKNHTHHNHNDHHSIPKNMADTVLHGKQDNFKLAVSATIHCLIGCGIGELIGMIISLIFGLDTVSSILLTITLGFVAGMVLGVRPLIRAGFSFSKALKTIFLAEGISIAVMEGFEVLTMIIVPGVMEAGILDVLFWIGMIGGLAVGFVAALPVNYVMIKRGVRHQH